MRAQQRILSFQRLLPLFVPPLLFAGALLLPVPPPMGRFLKYGSLSLTLVLTGLLFVLFRRKSVLPAACLLLALVGLVLSFGWQNDWGDPGALGGLLPVSDASVYTMDALRMLHGARFSPISSYRPLSHAFLALLLRLTGESYPQAVALLAGLAALALAVFAVEVRRTRGPLAAALSAAMLFQFYRIYAGKALTESLGLALGLLALALFLRAIRARSVWLALAGLAVFSLAMNARAGALLCLLALPGWLLWQFGRGVAWRGRLAGLALAALLLGFAANSVVAQAVAVKGGRLFSNAADSLYGVVSGYRGWRAIRSDHPGIDPADKLRVTVAQALAQPGLAALGVARAYADFANPAGFHLYSFLNLHAEAGDNLYRIRPGLPDGWWYLPVLLLAVLGLVSLLRRPHDPYAALVLAGLLGVLLSVPFAPPVDAGMRPYAVTLPFHALLAAEGLAFLLRRPAPAPEPAPPGKPLHAALIVGMALALLVLLPALARYTAAPPAEIALRPCLEGWQVYRLKPLRGAQLALVGEDASWSAKRPAIRRADFARNAAVLLLSEPARAYLAGLPEGATLQYTIDTGRIADAALPVFVVDRAGRLLDREDSVCARVVQQEFEGVFVETQP